MKQKDAIIDQIVELLRGASARDANLVLVFARSLTGKKQKKGD